MLEEGSMAPAFGLPDHQGHVRSLSDFAGGWLVVWWYPRACSETCSIQGRALAPAVTELRELGAAVVGISFDAPELNARFAAEEGLDFPLLSDETTEVGASYDVRRDPDERFADSPRRVTYLVDPSGRIRRSYLVTEVEKHPAVMIDDLRRLRLAGTP